MGCWPLPGPGGAERAGRRRARSRRRPYLTGAVITALLSAASYSGLLPVAGAATTKAQRELVGHWLGPFPGPSGRCGKGYSEWFLYATKSYTSTWNSAQCGGATAYGRYTVAGDLLTFHQQAVPQCPTCTQKSVIEVKFRFITANAMNLCDYPAGSCYTYYRQRG
jgi:hypothetical protein